MINPEQVLDEVWTQLALRLEGYGVTVSDQVAKLIAAEAINAWPGMATIKEDDRVTVAAVYLPLPQEGGDDD